jgi:hypothetical protein
MLADQSFRAHVARCGADRKSREYCAPDGRTIMPRPPHAKPPAYLSKNPPVPKPEPVKTEAGDPLGQDPTRYGDWTLKGIAVDF